MTGRTTFGAALGTAEQLGKVTAVLREFGADEAAVERDPAAVLREMLQTWKFLSERAAPPAPTRPKRAHFGYGFRPTLAQLVPGVTVRRYTENTRDGADTEIPCCDRPIHLPHDPGQWPDLYGCRFCGKAYDAALVDEGDGEGSYAAVFTVREETFVVAAPHKPRKDRSATR